MFYCLYNGKYYLSPERQPCKNTEGAIVFANEAKAKQFIENSPKNVKNLNYEVVILPCKNEIKPNCENLVSGNAIPDFFNTNDINECTNTYQQFLQQAMLNKEQYKEQLKDVEATIQDILHAAEFYTLNASRGFKLYKILHEERCKRRELKDMILKLEIITTSSLGDWVSGRVTARFNGLNKRQYEPRVLAELFE